MNNKVFLFTENIHTENSLPSQEFSDFLYFQTQRPSFPTVDVLDFSDGDFHGYENPLLPQHQIFNENNIRTFPYPTLIKKEELPFDFKHPPRFFLDFYKQTGTEFLLLPRPFSYKKIPYPAKFNVLKDALDLRDKMLFYLKVQGVLPRKFAEMFFAEKKRFLKDLLLRDWLVWRLFYISVFPEKHKENPNLQQAFLQAKTGFPLIDAMIVALQTDGFLSYTYLKILISFADKILHLPTEFGWQWYLKNNLFTETVWDKGLWYFFSERLEPVKPKKVFYFNYPMVSAKADPQARFIKKYLPELRKISPSKIHRLQVSSYVPPCVNFRERIVLYNKKYYKKNF